MGGPILGGTLGDAGLWRYIFFINVPIGLAALIILSLKVNERKDDGADQSIDISGAIAIALSLALLTFGFLRIPAVGLHSPQVYISLVAGVLLMIGFLYIEKTSKHPMMPLKLFSNETFSGVNLLTFFLYAGLGAGDAVSIAQFGAGTRLQPAAIRSDIFAFHGIDDHHCALRRWYCG